LGSCYRFHISTLSYVALVSFACACPHVAIDIIDGRFLVRDASFGNGRSATVIEIERTTHTPTAVPLPSAAGILVLPSHIPYASSAVTSPSAPITSKSSVPPPSPQR
jgi:hypothetical protein